MDFDSSAKFVASLAKFLQSLCNGYVDFDKGVEVIGHIHINVDSDLGKKVDYVLNERVCKNDNSITFISNSFPAQPAEKPPPPPKVPEADSNDNEHRVVMDDSGQVGPNSTNVGTMGPYAAVSRSNTRDGVYSPGSKRPRSPPQRRNMGAAGSPSIGKHGVSRSPRYHDSGGPQAKYGRANVPLSSVSNDYDGANVFQSGGDEDDYSSNYGDQSVSEVDQKPVIDPDIDIVKEEYVANQQSSCAYGGGNQTPGSGRGRGHSTPQYPGAMMNQSPANYSSASSQPSDFYAGSSLEGAGDPSTLTRAQQEELEMYYRKGTDQHLTFLRNMREAHAMYPFTGKRDKELFEKALQELFSRMPILAHDPKRAVETIYGNSYRKMQMRRLRANAQDIFAFPSFAHLGITTKTCFGDTLYKCYKENAKKTLKSR